MNGPARAAAVAIAAIAASTGCKGQDGEVACRPGALGFSRPASLVAEPSGSLFDVRVAAVGTSSFAVVWSEGPSLSDNDLWGRRVGLDGTLQSSPLRITQAAGPSSAIRLEPGPGGLGVSWTDGRFTQQVAMATVLSSGFQPVTPLPAVFQSPVVAADQAPIPDLAVTGTGWLVAWNGRGNDGYDHLFVQGLGPDGAAAGEPVALVPAQSDRATPPTIAAAGTGGAAVIVDEELRPGVPDPDVFAYLVAGTGAVVAADRFGDVSDARSPEAVGLFEAAGVLWLDRRDGNRPDLYYARMGSGERRLTEGPASHVAPAVASLGDAFLVQWIAAAEGAAPEVRVRAFLPDGRPAAGAQVAGEGVFGDVAWHPRVRAAGVVWVGSDATIWFRPLACQ